MSEAWFTTVSSRRVYEGWSTVRVDRIRTPDGSEADREIVEHMDAVAVVPVDESGHVVLLRQYRHAIGGYVLEIPAGKLDVEGEEPDVAAQRELREEIGHEAVELVPLTTFLNSAGWTDERTHVYLGRGLRTAEAPEGFTAEAEEADMEIVRIHLDDAVAAVHAGDLQDSKSVIGLLLAAAKLAS